MQGVTILPGGKPLPYDGPGPAEDAVSFFRSSVPKAFTGRQCHCGDCDGDTDKFVYTSFDSNGSPLKPEDNIRPSGDSFVRGALDAWARHQHLVIRPEEVWFTILVQMNYYMEGNAEKLRHLFVDHEGQKKLVVWGGSWPEIIEGFQDLLHEEVKVKWLRDWVLPDFSTTRPHDRVTATVLMMGLTKAYFAFGGGIICGLPSVTLLGTKEDWQKLVDRLDKLPEFGEEPTAYSERLRPVLSQFVQSFDSPDSAETRGFWNRIVTAQHVNLCGVCPWKVSGWITAFFYWKPEGKPYARPPDKEYVYSTNEWVVKPHDPEEYPYLPVDDLPLSYVDCPFTIKDSHFPENDKMAKLIAGPLGKRVTPGPPSGYLPALRRAFENGVDVGGGVDVNGSVEGHNGLESAHSTVQPISAWALYIPPPPPPPTSLLSRLRSNRHLGDAEVSSLLHALELDRARSPRNAASATKAVYTLPFDEAYLKGDDELFDGQAGDRKKGSSSSSSRGPASFEIPKRKLGKIQRPD